MKIPENSLTLKAGKFPQINRKWVWLAAPLIVVIGLLLLYAIKGVYPFGNNSIVNYDLYYGGVPGMYYVWDAWHSGNLFYDFTTACGFGRNVSLELFHPQNLFLWFFPRSMIYNAVSILLIIKFALIAFTSSYTFSKLFPKLPASWVMLTSVMYTFSGYTLQYYTNIDWLDTVALYPLIILFALNMFKGKSKLPYFLVLTYTLTFNTYMAWFVVLSLIIFGGLYIFIVEEKQNRKSSIFALGVGTGASLLANCYTIYNYFGGVSSGARYNTGSFTLNGRTGEQEIINGFSDLLSTRNTVDIVAVFMFLGTAVAFAMLIIMWFRFKKHKDSRKYTLFFTISVILLVLEIAVKATMLLWHGGSYQYFPFRNGYMVSFFCCLIVGYYITRFDSLDGLKFNRPLLNPIPFLPLFFLIIGIISYAQVFYFSLKNFDVLSTYIAFQTGTLKYPYSILALLLIITFITIRFIGNKHIRNSICFILSCTFIILNINTLVYIRNPNNENDPVDSRYTDCYEIEKVSKQNDIFSRINDPDLFLITNYPYVSGISSISNWTHSLSNEQIESFKNLGFSTQFTLLYDSGGTQFSKALLRVTNAVSKKELNNNFYSKTAETKRGFNYYDCNYTLPSGIVFKPEIKNIKFEDYKNTFDYQEAIYETLSGEKGLFEKVIPEKSNNKLKKEEFYRNVPIDGDENNKKIEKYTANLCTSTLQINIKGKKALYLALDTSNECSIAKIKINGKPVIVENAIQNKTAKNYIFPNSSNNNILELGVFKNESVNAVFKFANEFGDSNNLVLYTMDVDKLNELCNSQKGNNYKVNGDTVTVNCNAKNGENVVFIPLAYEDAWQCTVNGKNVKPFCILGDFMGIEINGGENEITLKYSHSKEYLQIFSIIAGFILGIVILLFEKHFRKRVPKPILTLFFILFGAIFAGTITVLYIIPGGFSFVLQLLAFFK